MTTSDTHVPHSHKKEEKRAAQMTESSQGSLRIPGPDWQPGRHDRTAAAPHPEEGYTWRRSPLRQRQMERRHKSQHTRHQLSANNPNYEKRR